MGDYRGLKGLFRLYYVFIFTLYPDNVVRYFFIIPKYDTYYGRLGEWSGSLREVGTIWVVF